MDQGYSPLHPGAGGQAQADTQDHGQEIKATVTEIYCIQTNYELQKERLERLEGIVRSYKIALLSQERKLREIEEGNKRIGEDLQVQVK